VNSRITRSLTAVCVFLFLLYAPSFCCAQIKVAAGDLEDSRRTDGFFNRLKADLKISGPGLGGARGARVLITRAVDETGKDLLGEKEPDRDFKELDVSDSSEARLQIELKNPERRAATIREISGTVEIFSPQRDPKSTIVVPNFQKNIGTPLANPSLKSAGIQITLWTKEMFDARKKAEEDKLNKQIESKAKQAEKSGNLEDAVNVLGEGLTAIFGGMMSSFATMGENDLAFRVQDPASKLISISIEDAQGKPIERGGRMTIGGSDERTIIYNFEQKPPANARIRLFVLTPAAIVKAPFKLTGVTLP
jgi:hypothetical protein